MRRLIVAGSVCFALLCQGCTLFVSVPPLDPLPEKKVVLRQVTYAPQEEDWDCGPACLTTVLRHEGSRLSLREVKAQLKRTRDGGVIVPEMLYGARKNGFRVKMYEGSINDLRRTVLAGKPLILMLHPTPRIVRHVTRRRGHYVVAVGYNDPEREAVIHSGTEPFATVSYRRLQLEWSRANFLTLLIEKK